MDGSQLIFEKANTKFKLLSNIRVTKGNKKSQQEESSGVESPEVDTVLSVAEWKGIIISLTCR